MSPARCRSVVLGALLALCLSCADSTAPPLQPPPPTSPSPPSIATSGMIWGQVLDSLGACLHGGMVQIVDGPYMGRGSRQPDDCDAWDYTGFEIDSLPLGMTVTLHASAPGYRSANGQATAQRGGGPVHFVLVPE